MQHKKALEGYIDIHAHLLPVQDGPKSMEEAIEAVKLAVESGIVQMILTPHYFSNDLRYRQEDIQRIFEEFKLKIAEADIPIKLHLGNELNIDQTVVESLQNGKALPLANSNFVLAEYPFYQVPCNYESVIYDLMNHGYIPIIAHPERNAFIGSQFEQISELKHMGCYIQMNAASYLGDYGPLAKKYAVKMISEGLVDFIASDAHSLVQRPPDVLMKMVEKVQKLIGYKALVEMLGYKVHKTLFSGKGISRNAECQSGKI